MIRLCLMQKILLIEDDTGIITPLSIYIEQSGYDLTVCSDGSLASTVFSREKPTLVILDINLPGKNGIEICREIREISSTPIIILSARESEDDKVMLLELGADDYVSKPFSPRELMARIATIIKRVESQKKIKSHKVLTLGNISIDAKNFTVQVGGKEIKLTKTEFALLEYFAKNTDGVIKRESLMKDIIGYENYLYDRTIDTHVKNLRKKIGESVEIETIRGIGYRIHVKI
jgi:DNA-binding response OmpR family regulator